MNLRKSALTGQIMLSFGYAKRLSEQIHELFGTTPILQLSRELDISPIVIIVTILQHRIVQKYPSIGRKSRSRLLQLIVENCDVHSCRKSCGILS